jgi:hypothetical protein
METTMTFLKSLPNLFFGLSTAFTLGFVIGWLTGDTWEYMNYDGYVFQGLFFFGWTLSWLPKGFWQVWFAAQPWILFWSLTDF